jgi:hypothetical protein
MRNLKPAHLLMIRMFADGFSYVEIASETGYSNQQVMNILQSGPAQEILSQLQETVLDSMAEVHQRLNDVAPRVLDKKIRHALQDADMKVSNQACTDLLHMAGHMPVRQVRIEAGKVNDKYAGMTEDEIRDKIIAELTQASKGPDGSLLN